MGKSIHFVQPSHVAVLVPSVRKAAEYLKRFQFQVGPEEDWDGEGTREIYIEQEKANSLLLMEAIKPGAYQRALEKRGPGLHHLAIDVSTETYDLETFIHSLSGSGWLLHPSSLKKLKDSQTVYLSRPGFPALIEVQGKSSVAERPLFVSDVGLAINEKLIALGRPIGLQNLLSISTATTLKLGSHTIALTELF